MKCDIAIVGAGPAGLTAALYGARAGLDVTVLEMGVPGGQIMNTDWIENYPGFPEGLTGVELMTNFLTQATNFEQVSLVMGHVTRIDREGTGFRITYGSEDTLLAKALIVATGANPRALGVAGEKELTGSGVSYCAVCDGAFFRDKEVAVVGGGDTALEDAVFLTKFARKVTMIHRRDAFRGAKILQERVRNNEKIELAMNRTVEEIHGNGKVESLTLQNVETLETDTLNVDGVFILVGTKPNTGWINEDLQLDMINGYLTANDEMQTSIPGLFAAGDVRKKMLRQVSTAVGDGAVAAVSAARYIEEN